MTKTSLKTFLLILTFLTFASFLPKKPLHIKIGQDVDGLKLKSSTVRTAITKYGKNTGFTQGIACGDHDYFTNRFSFSKQRVTIISETIDNEDKNTSIITKIGISYPCDAETEEGINLLRDNVNKILQVYGKPEGADTSKATIDIHYNSKGISFRYDRNFKGIQKIEIYIPYTSPDFWY